MHKTTSSIHFSKRTVSAAKEAGTHWTPNTDVYACETGIVIKVELAGLQRDNLELTIDGNRLKISGQRPDECRGAKCKFLVMEINYGAFETIIDLPAGCELTKAKASYQNGFLRIDVPIKELDSKAISIAVS